MGKRIVFSGEIVRNEGATAYARGIPINRNEYKGYDNADIAWRLGWMDAAIRNHDLSWVNDESVKPKSLNSAKAEQEAAKANGGWMPIESAPKDGSVILLLCSGKSVAGYWHIPKDCEYCFDELDGAWYALIPYIWSTIAGRVVAPTKWQPLPPPPEQTP